MPPRPDRPPPRTAWSRGANSGRASPPVERALDHYLAGRTTGPLFLDDQGRRMYEAQAWRLVRRLARRAGIKSAGQLSPHSLLHTYATSLDHAGDPLQDIQDANGPRRPAHHPSATWPPTSTSTAD